MYVGVLIRIASSVCAFISHKVNFACQIFFRTFSFTSQKHTYKILTPLNPLLYLKTGVYKGYTLFFLYLLKNIYCGYSLEPPHRGRSNEYPQSMYSLEPPHRDSNEYPQSMFVLVRTASPIQLPSPLKLIHHNGGHFQSRGNIS